MRKIDDAHDAPNAAVFIGCAGWSLSSAVSQNFPEEGSHLQRYASVLPAVEINTSFYRPHRPGTYARWRDSVPENFRFSAKIPRQITHDQRLKECDEALMKFISEVSHLEHKLGCLLVQLPPSLRFEAKAAERFFTLLRRLTEVDIVCEPRHATWFDAMAASLLDAWGISYVEADPQIASLPVSRDGRTSYLRLHGNPVIYHSTYPEDYLDEVAAKIERNAYAGRRVWCVFDNTASGAAVPNALSLLARLGPLAAPMTASAFRRDARGFLRS